MRHSSALLARGAVRGHGGGAAAHAGTEGPCWARGPQARPLRLRARARVVGPALVDPDFTPIRPKVVRAS